MKRALKITGGITLITILLSVVLRLAGQSLYSACCGRGTFAFGGALCFLGPDLRELSFGTAHFVIMVALPVFCIALMTARAGRWIQFSMIAICAVTGWLLSGYWAWQLVCAG